MKRIVVVSLSFLLLLLVGCSKESCAGETAQIPDSNEVDPIVSNEKPETIQVTVTAEPVFTEEKTEEYETMEEESPSPTIEGDEISVPGFPEQSKQSDSIETQNKLNEEKIESNSIDDKGADINNNEKVDSNINHAPNGSTSYEQYYAMSSEQQKEFFDSFESPEAFFAWLDAAREAYEGSYESIEVGNEPFDIGDYANNE